MKPETDLSDPEQDTIQIPATMVKMIALHNIKDGEQVYQRCILVSGKVYTSAAGGEDVVVFIRNEVGTTTFPQQRWPIREGHFKAFIILSPGLNVVEFARSNAASSSLLKIKLIYIPPLQNPPLHLAILIARDSPLLIDCPPAKAGALTSTHSSLEAAIVKFRMTAYMWQAITAEGLRAKGFGHRSFRLEEEWSVDTLSRHYLNSSDNNSNMHSTAKIHLVRTSKTVAELRDPALAPHDLHTIFLAALKEHGGVFATNAHPVVAGLILDSHASMEKKVILANAARGENNPAGISLAVMGSQFTFAWPRFIEEAADCLLDLTKLEDYLDHQSQECMTMGEMCDGGQGTFLREIGHAFGALCSDGNVAERLFSWPSGFEIQKPLKDNALTTMSLDSKTIWDIRDALKFRALKHFSLPGEKPIIDAPAPTVELFDEDDISFIKITSELGIVRTWIRDHDAGHASVANPQMNITYSLVELETNFDRAEPLSMEFLDVNGKSTCFDAWKQFTNRRYIQIPGTSIRLCKISVSCNRNETPNEDDWQWAVMLKKRTKNGNLIPASHVDIRVGCILDGAEVYYKDGSKIPCGRRWDADGNDCHMGGHQAKKLALPKSTEIVKVAVTLTGEPNATQLLGLRMWRSDGKALGATNTRGSKHDIEYLKPQEGQKIVGFYGRSRNWGYCAEFGIITAPRDVELPDTAYDLPELQNTDGGLGPRGGKSHGIKVRYEIMESSDDEEFSEDDDDGYDDYSDGDETMDGN